MNPGNSRPSAAWRTLVQVFLVMAVFTIEVGVAPGQDQSPAYMVKAAMLFNFLKFTDFPADRLAVHQDITLCVGVSDVQQRAALFSLADRRIANHTLNVVNLAADAHRCQVLYVDTRQRWETFQSSGAPTRLLTVSAFPGFTQAGGMIEMDVRPDGIKFDVNLPAARRAGFHFSPQMLLLARKVYE